MGGDGVPGLSKTPVEHQHHARADHAYHAAQAGHDRHTGPTAAMFRDKFVASLLLTLPISILGHMLQRVFGYTAPHFPGADWVPPAFGTAVFAYGGWVFIQGAARELKQRLPGMMTLIALAISVAFVFSAIVSLGYPGTPLWEELATLVTIMLFGQWIQGLGARSGLLVRNRRGVEEARNLNTVVFDKTGTFTRGEFGVVEIHTRDDLASDEALRLAAAVVEADSEHAIAQRILRTANQRGINLWWAAGYNIVAIPLAAGVLAAYGFVLSPSIGAVLMSASTVIVAINAQLLRRWRL